MWEWERVHDCKPPISFVGLNSSAMYLGPSEKQPILSIYSTLFLRGEVRTGFQSDLTVFPSFCGFQSAPWSSVEGNFFRCGLNT